MRLLAPLLVAVALAASACGGDVVSRPGRQGGGRSTGAQTKRARLDAERFTAANGTRVVMAGTGDFQNSPQLGSMTMTIGSSSKTISMTEVMKDWTVYMTSPVFPGSSRTDWWCSTSEGGKGGVGTRYSSLTGLAASTLQRSRASARRPCRNGDDQRRRDDALPREDRRHEDPERQEAPPADAALLRARSGLRGHGGPPSAHSHGLHHAVTAPPT